MAEFRWVPMLFGSGFVSSERLEPKPSKLAVQGARAELGDPSGACLITFLPPELHTPLGQPQCQNMLEVLSSLHLT